jgi:hypothetical protein
MSQFERLEKYECIEAYAKQILSDRRNLVLVTSVSPHNNSRLHERIPFSAINSTDVALPAWGCDSIMGNYNSSWEFDSISCISNTSLYAILGYDMGILPASAPIHTNWYYWICSQFSSYQDMMPDENARQAPDFLRHPQSRKALCSDGGYKQANTQREPWSVFGFEVDYCISEKPDEKCSLDVAISLLLTVIAFDLIRVTTMIVSMYCRSLCLLLEMLYRHSYCKSLTLWALGVCRLEETYKKRGGKSARWNTKLPAWHRVCSVKKKYGVFELAVSCAGLLLQHRESSYIVLLFCRTS